MTRGPSWGAENSDVEEATMTDSNGEWKRVESVPQRPLVIEDLAEVRAQYPNEASTWIEVNNEAAKRDLGLEDCSEAIIINFVVRTSDDNTHQYRFDGDGWEKRGPFSSEPGSAWISEAGSLWTEYETLLERTEAPDTETATGESQRDMGRSGNEWETDMSLPSHPATPRDLAALRDTFAEAYGTDATLWIDTDFIEHCAENTASEQLDDRLISQFSVEAADACYRFEFNPRDREWKRLGPKTEWEITDGGVSALDHLINRDNSTGEYQWDLPSSQTEIIVAIEDLAPYSSIHLTPQDQDVLTDAITERIERQTDTTPSNPSLIDALAELHEVVQQSAATLRLDVGQHDRLRTALRESSTGAYLASRLRRAEPDCYFGCEASGYQQIRIDDSVPYTICADCKAALMSADGFRLLQRIDPEVTADHEIITQHPDQGKETIIQTALDEYR